MKIDIDGPAVPHADHKTIALAWAQTGVINYVTSVLIT